jgi:hypothetical protein
METAMHRSRVTFSNVVALLALLMAVGGTSYAAARLAANSVGTRELKNAAVTKAKVRAGSLDATRFHNGSAIDAYVGQPTGTTEGTAMTAISTVHVPAGRYVITAKLYAISHSGLPRTLTCGIWAGGASIDTMVATSTTDLAHLALPLQGVATLSAAGSVELQCLVSGSGATGGEYELWYPKLAATRVAVLH